MTATFKPSALAALCLLAGAVAVVGGLQCPVECCPDAGACSCSASVSCDSLGLTAVPSGEFPGILALDLDENDIDVLSSLSGFPDLSQISLSNNHLDILDLEQFNGTQIVSIFAPKNAMLKIYRLPYTMALPTLRALFLSQNHIWELGSNDLFGVDGLTRLVLDMNPLRTLPVSAVDGRIAIGGTLSFSNTPLACGCQYQELSDWARSNGVQIIASCAGRPPCDFETKYHEV